MKIGNLFKAVVKLPLVPIGLIADVATMGVEKIYEGEYFIERAVNSIADDLNE